ncbi:hypothetical protein, partial [Salmonella sp. s54925]|uniref:hypothetical protein n=1 Tax=Salmonella sp. s54925 TaxID=3159674 RepID=UPI0039815CD0
GGNVDCIWDCNSLGAVFPDQRKDYLKTSLGLLRASPNSRILQESFVYETKDPLKGAPYSVSLDDLTSLLGDKFELEILCKEDQSEEMHARFGVSSLAVLIVC